MDELCVECRPERPGLHPGARGERVPVRFGPPGGALRAVVEVIDRWPGEDHRYFRVRDETGAVVILRQDLRRGAWQLVFFERGGGANRA